MVRLLPALLLSLVVGAGAQEAAAPAPVPTLPTLTARSTLVLVPTTVRTKKGEPVFTLKASDFTVTDDGVPQTVRLEEDTDTLPLALVVVVESGGDGAGKLPAYRSLGTMVEAIVGAVPHRVALIGFDSQPTLIQPWTESLDEVERGIGELQAGDGKAAVLDALQFSVELLRKQPPEYRRAILLVSETVDHGSQVRMEDALRAVSDTNTVIYSLGFSSTRAEAVKEAARFNSKEPGPPNGCMGDDPNVKEGSKPSKGAQALDCLEQLAPPLRLAKIAVLAAMGGFRKNVPETAARLTGGEYFHFENAKGLEKSLGGIANRLPNRYFLSFQPQQPHEGLHAVGVELKGYSGLLVEARRSYWAEGAGQGPTN